MMSNCKAEVLRSLQDDIQKDELPPLLSREFLPAKNGHDATIQTDNELRVFQWNILAQALCQGEDNFVLCPPEALVWKNRKTRILEEMTRYNASIYCLQEVDCFKFISEHFAKIGYKGVFYPKPQSPCLDQEENFGPDGCAIFYDKEKFDLLETKDINLKIKRMVTNQVAILCKFKRKHASNGTSKFFVAVTHLKARTGYEEIRHQQGKYLLDKLTKAVGSYPLILTGDFNAIPSEPIYRELQESKLGLCSAYTHLSEERQEPPYTAWQIRGSRKGKGNVETSVTIDYIWLSKSLLKVKSLLGIPSESEIGEVRLPSSFYPSDHLSLVCDVQFVEN